MSGNASDFDIAKEVSSLLSKIDSPRQELVLRWVRESLGLEGAAIPEKALTPLGNAAAGTPPITATGGSVQLDIKTFAGQKSPKSDAQFAAVVAYFHRFVAPEKERHDTITSELLQDAARLVGRDRLVRPSLTLTNAKNQGYLDLKDRGNYRINAVGENLVAMTLPGSPARQAKPTARNKKKR